MGTIMNMKKYFKKLLIFLIVFYNLVNLFAQDIENVYRDILFTETFNFYNDGKYTQFKTSYLDDCGYHPHRVQSFGTYYIKDHYYYLNSDPKIDSLNINMAVNEYVFQSDSVYVIIISPYENLISNTKYDKMYQYIITIYGKNSNNQNSIVERKTDNNLLAIAKTEAQIIDSIMIRIELKYNDIQAIMQNLSTMYNLKNKNSNFLIFDFQNFDYFYFYYTRYKDFPIKIKNRNEFITNSGNHLYTEKKRKQIYTKMENSSKLKSFSLKIKHIYWNFYEYLFLMDNNSTK
jgi:hypothetical protein